MLDYAILHYTAKLLNEGKAPTTSNLVDERTPEQREDLRNRHNQAVQELKIKLKESQMENSRKLEARRTQIREKYEEYKVERAMKYTGTKSTAEIQRATIVHSTDTRRDKQW